MEKEQRNCKIFLMLMCNFCRKVYNHQKSSEKILDFLHNLTETMHLDTKREYTKDMTPLETRA